MRILLAVLPLSVLAACQWNWELDNPVDTSVEKFPFFYDQDGDGWGDANAEPQMRIDGDETLRITARNNRDCDDGVVEDDADSSEITGRLGSTCPQNLVVASGKQSVSYVGRRSGDSEYVALYGESTPTVWPAAAVAACSPWGWGGIAEVDDQANDMPWRGGLATFDNKDQLEEVTSRIEEKLPLASEHYAGYIGIVPDGSGGWKWFDGSQLDLDAVTWCAGSPPDPDRYDRVALAKIQDDEAGVRWCLGLPGDAAEGSAAYDDQMPIYGHFICERPKPVISDYDVFLTE